MPPKGTKVSATRKAVVKVFDDIMLDLETLDTSATASIISIGAVRFNETEIDDAGFYRVIKIQSNLDEHRTISGSTLAWWIGQDARAKAIFSDPDAVDLGQALDDFRDWVGPIKNVRMWGNGSDFDCSILKNAYGLQGEPWVFWNTRCLRTVKSSMIGRTVQKVEPAIAHHAMHDALAQAKTLQAIWAAEKNWGK